MPILQGRGAHASLRAWTSLALVLACVAPDVRAQEAGASAGQIRGQIVEARTAAPLPAVLVQVEATRQRAISDADGNFTIDGVPLGAQTLIVSVVGFGLVRREVTVIAQGIEVTIPVAEGASTYVEEVAVTAGRFREAQPGAASQAVLGSRELLALRGVIADDPFRAVQVLPGVAASDDYRAEFAVRGLGPYHVGLSIDDVDSRLLFHTVRGVQETGSLALINSDILEEATLLSGVHPQKLGSHLGASLGFRTRDGARDHLRGRALVSGSATTVVVEGPLGSGTAGSWLVAGRKSYIDWILRRVDTSINGTFGFADAQGKLTWMPTPSQTLRVSVLGGQSELDEDDDDPTDFDRGSSRTAIGNLQWRWTRSPRLALTQQLYLVDARYRNRIGDGRPREEGSDRDLTWRATVEWAPRPAHFVEIGGQAQSLAAARIDRRFFGSSEVTILDTQSSASSQAAWMSYRWAAAPHVTIIPGARIERWARLDHTAASPWVLAEWQLSGSTRVRSGVGVQRQAPGLDEMLFGVPERPMRPERARLADLGVERTIGGGWRTSATAYYRKESDRLRVVDGEARLVGGRVVRPAGPAYVANVMDGTAHGLELIVERRSSSGLTGWLSYAYGHAENTDRGVRTAGQIVPEETFTADWDQRHTLNTNVDYRWSERSSLSVRYRYGSNFPLQGYYALIDTERHVLTAERNAARLPPYSRLDIRADRAFTYRAARLTLFAEVINALGHSNYRTQGASLNARTGEVSGLLERLFPLLPSAGVLIEF